MSCYQAYQNQGTELTLGSTLIRLLHNDATPRNKSEESESDSGSRSSGSKKNRRGSGIKIQIPKRNIQKMPAGMNRI
jgi:hypothetical protein